MSGGTRPKRGPKGQAALDGAFFAELYRTVEIPPKSREPFEAEVRSDVTIYLALKSERPLPDELADLHRSATRLLRLMHWKNPRPGKIESARDDIQRRLASLSDEALLELAMRGCASVSTPTIDEPMDALDLPSPTDGDVLANSLGNERLELAMGGCESVSTPTDDQPKFEPIVAFDLPSSTDSDALAVIIEDLANATEPAPNVAGRQGRREIAAERFLHSLLKVAYRRATGRSPSTNSEEFTSLCERVGERCGLDDYHFASISRGTRRARKRDAGLFEGLDEGCESPDVQNDESDA